MVNDKEKMIERFDPVRLWNIHSDDLCKYHNIYHNSPKQSLSEIRAEEFDPNKHGGFSGKCVAFHKDGETFLSGIQAYDDEGFGAGSSHDDCVCLLDKQYKEKTGLDLKIDDCEGNGVLEGFLTVDCKRDIMMFHGKSEGRLWSIVSLFSSHEDFSEFSSGLNGIVSDYANKHNQGGSFGKNTIMFYGNSIGYRYLSDEEGNVDLSESGALMGFSRITGEGGGSLR